MIASEFDYNWIDTVKGQTVLNSIRSNKKLKTFGLLEKPSFMPCDSHTSEIKYKLGLIGNSFTGKTTLIEAISQSCIKGVCGSNSISIRRGEGEGNQSQSSRYIETPGISVTHLYWPCKLKQQKPDEYILFDLAFWDIGKSVSIKYDYMRPEFYEDINALILIFSWTDKKSFLDLFNFIERLNETANEDINRLPRFIIGTKFDQIIHSEIDREMVNELERLADTKVIRLSTPTCTFSQISSLMNLICNQIWSASVASSAS